MQHSERENAEGLGTEALETIGTRAPASLRAFDGGGDPLAKPRDRRERGGAAVGESIISSWEETPAAS